MSPTTPAIAIDTSTISMPMSSRLNVSGCG